MNALKLAACVLLTATLMAQTSAKSKSQSSNPKFAKLTEQFIHESLALSPSAASQAGYHKHTDPKTGKVIELDAELDDLSPQGIAAQRRFYEQWRERFRKEMPQASLGAEDAADWRLIDDQIGLNLLEFDRIQNYKYNPTVYVELLGSALFQPLTEEYAVKEVRLGHILSRVEQTPRFLEQAKQNLVNADPIFVKVAIEENAGNIDLVENTIAQQIPAGSPLRARYEKVGPPAIQGLKGFSAWLENELGKRPPSRTWRLGKEMYAEKFRLVMETPITPEQVLADAEHQLGAVRAEMLQIAIPLHKQMYPDHSEHAELSARERESKIVAEVLQRISDNHAQPDELMATVKADVDAAKQFIREKKIVNLPAHENLKVIPTPVFMRGVYSVAGFHGAPPLNPTAEAQYWVTPIAPNTPPAKAESKLREYNKWALQWLTLHESLPGHYVQAEHANTVQPQIRRVLRGLFANGPYVEGWAEYAAQVVMNQGFDDNDPRYRISYLKIWLRAIVNSILDVRMQTMNMSDQQALDLMMIDAFQTEAEAQGKLVRAKLSSAQLPTYFVGNRDWWRLRHKYQAAKGNSFSLEEFHDRALNEGAIPLSELEKILLPESGMAAGL